ncbi:unnamed protein product [marine sediment metagenome]|uniref:DUF3786 domain-containing protein n=2 Tax=marine sediment metagenome TaxID=412755 RepID=X1U142_9ZZZZ
MESSYLSLPNQQNYEYGYELAYKLACEQLAKFDNIGQQCLKSGAQYQVIDSQEIIILEYLNQSYQIVFPDIDISLIGSEEEVPMRDKILILHYLTQAKGTPITNKITAFRELPEGANYFPTFSKRAIKPLLDHFGREPERLIDAAEKLGGHRVDYGDVAVTINAFSYVPITLVLWQGNGEFAPEGSILFDSTISDYLSTYDITVLCETISWKLVKYLKESLNIM